ncbi:hypothetical protein CfE428DRAFT_4015 [Chthoniobacter flavus Ellin428]|uniref:Uncharacterized protein n=1 Tax=Chthoniobacter flavus Ellin428 TaxID=497964 RepID=B4D526_9BACT|nr:hypothetical protein [Chthoniobacter flavus]EDY18629.1 hypothetical protein CfE428DRAFT_4015 [Chthoniobacter flavus Ellin428]TCO90915.1 hypothetical protein EV701_10964 [Chthoniobacter flavus]
MSTVTEIERAIALLPPEQWAEIRRWMDSQLPPTDVNARKQSVDWSQSMGVKRARRAEECVAAEAVLDVLREARE